MSLEERLRKVFQEALELKEPFNTEELRYNEFPRWNSLGHMSLVAGIETEFDCIMETDDILAMSSFDKTLEIVSKYHAGN